MLQRLFTCNNCGRDLLMYPHTHTVRIPIYRDGELVGASFIRRCDNGRSRPPIRLNPG